MTTSSGARRSPRRAPAAGHRQVDADRTRAALLDAALEEFAAKGFAGARVRDIAERAGVSKDLVPTISAARTGSTLRCSKPG